MSGSTTINEQTAAMVGIHRFRKSNRMATSTFIESGRHQQPIYEDVPLTIPGVSTVMTDIVVGGNNLVNPAVFLPSHDIAFHSCNFVTFLAKDSRSPHIGAAIPYLKGTETAFNWRIGHHILPMLLDTGGDFSMVKPNLAHDIALAAYPKTAHWDTTEDDFDFAYITPVSLPGTPVRFMSEIHIGPGRSIISGPELLQKDLAIRRRAVDDNMRFSDVVVAALKMYVRANPKRVSKEKENS
jgi:hypothetical protein